MLERPSLARVIDNKYWPQGFNTLKLFNRQCPDENSSLIAFVSDGCPLIPADAVHVGVTPAADLPKNVLPAEVKIRKDILINVASSINSRKCLVCVRNSNCRIYNPDLTIPNRVGVSETDNEKRRGILNKLIRFLSNKP